MSLISSAISGLKHHSPDKTIYLGHGRSASGTQEHLFACTAIISLLSSASFFRIYGALYFAERLGFAQLLIEAASPEM